MQVRFNVISCPVVQTFLFGRKNAEVDVVLLHVDTATTSIVSNDVKVEGDIHLFPFVFRLLL